MVLLSIFISKSVYSEKKQSHSFILSVASLSVSASLSEQPDHNLTDGSHLLRLSNQNLRISWVTARALATVPSVSVADEGSLVKLRRVQRSVTAGAVHERMMFFFSLSHTFFFSLGVKSLSSRLHQIHIYPTLRIKRRHVQMKSGGSDSDRVLSKFF